MVRILSAILTAFCLVASATAAEEAELTKMQGKWEVKKTHDDGQKVTQTIEMKKDKLTFKIVNDSGETIFAATADVKPEKLGPFTTLTITNVKAGGSLDSLEEAPDEKRSYVYQFGYQSWTIVSDIDAERDQSPRIDVYKKVSK